MDDSQRLLSIVGSIYDAAIDGSLWSMALTEIREYVEGEEATLFWKDLVANGGNVFIDTGRMDRAYIRSYFETYAKLDPSTAAHFFADLDQPVSLVDFAEVEEFRESRFNKEWAQPQGFTDFVTCSLDKAATSVAMFGVFRHERHGLVDDGVRRRMSLVSPHMRRAVMIGRIVDRHRAEAASLADALDGLSAGMLLLDESGHIIHANEAAEALMARGIVASDRSGRIVLKDADAARELGNVLAASAVGDTALGSQGIAIAMRGTDDSHFVGHVLPLKQGRRRLDMAYKATAALFLRKAELATASVPELVGKAFKLTPAELRVLLGVVEVGGVPDVATALGISEPTVKTHLQRIFVKTGASRQADLAKLMAEFADPTGR